MGSLALAVMVASLLGSLHCVGMCGPLALWASDTRHRRLSLAAYHGGRLTTYLSAGLMAGLVGSTLTISGQVAGFQSAAAKLAGAALVAIGVLRVARALGRKGNEAVGSDAGDTSPAVSVTPAPSRIAGWLHHARPVVASQGPIGRGYLAGLLTTWLPCGWLYLFVLVAAGTGDVISAMLVMTAFWVGTLPALTGVVLGAGTMMRRHPQFVTLAAGLLLIATGLYTATGRATADLTTIARPNWRAGEPLDPSEVDQPLPCCQPGVSADEQPGE